jgi:hypothetical protein
MAAKTGDGGRVRRLLALRGITATTRFIFLRSSSRTWFDALCAYRAIGAAVIMPSA